MLLLLLIATKKDGGFIWPKKRLFKAGHKKKVSRTKIAYVKPCENH
jgi:hypothetical protein